MKIVHAYKIYRPDVDGGIPQVMALLTGDNTEAMTSEIVVARYRGWARRFVMDGTQVTAVASLGTLFSTPLAPTYPFVLRERAREADVLVHHAPFPLTDLGIAAGLSDRTALVVYWHAEILGRTLLRKLLTPAIKSALRRADRIVVSDEAMIDHSEFLAPHRDKCAVVRYGIDLDYWSNLDDASQLAVVGLRQHYPRLIVAVGRLVGYKGLDVLLNALPLVDAQLVIIGEGSLLDDLQRQAIRSGVADRVFFKGRVSSDDIKHHLHAARMLVLSSVTDAEAFGLVQVEAMAARIPVINTNLPTTVPHVARHEQEGLTVAVGNAEALAQAMDRLLADTALADRLGQAGLNRAQSEFGRQAYCAKMAEIFEQAVARRRAMSGRTK